MLAVPEVPIVKFKDNLRDMGLEWPWGTIVDHTRGDQVYWATTEGLTSAYCSTDAKRGLHLVSRRIHLSSKRMNVTYPRAIVVACIIQGIKLNVAAQIISKWKMFY